MDIEDFAMEAKRLHRIVKMTDDSIWEMNEEETYTVGVDMISYICAKLGKLVDMMEEAVEQQDTVSHNS